jgi:hypothetical protein
MQIFSFLFIEFADFHFNLISKLVDILSDSGDLPGNFHSGPASGDSALIIRKFLQNVNTI